MRSITAFTFGMTSSPSTRTGWLLRLRRATCSTARFSVLLILSPLNMRSRQPATSASSASRTSRLMVSSVMRFFE